MRNRNHNGRIATVLVAALAALVGTLCLVGTASAQTIYTWKYDGTFPAGSTTLADALPPSGAGPERPRNVHFDQASNLLYASSYGFPENFGEPPPNRIFKMNAAMKSVPWSAFEPNTWLQIPELNGTYAVDNSGTASQGRIYYVDTLGSPRQLRALQPSGLPYTEGFPYVPADPDICGVAVDPEGDIWMSHFNNGVALEGRPNGFIEEIGSDGVPTGEIIYTYANSRGSGSEMCDLVIDADGEIYISGVWASIKETSNLHGGIHKYASDGTKHKGSIDPSHNFNGNNETRPLEIDRSTGEFFFSDGNDVRVYDAEGGYASTFGGAEGSFPGLFGANGMTIDEDTHKIYISKEGGCCSDGRVDRFARQAGVTVPDVRSLGFETTTNAATLRGTVNADGIATTDCYFEWGPLFNENNTMANKADCVVGNTPTDVFTGNTTNQVKAEIGGLVKGTMYHYRLVSKNANDVLSRGIAGSFRASGKPIVENVSASNIDTGGAILSLDLTTNGSETRYHFEWGKEAGVYTDSAPVQPNDLDWEWFRAIPKGFSEDVTGLDSETTYHFRVVAENDAGTTATPDQTFRTFAKDPEGDVCDNAHVRQQTSTRLMLDCRAYELVSARYAGGYDVESDLGPGQVPLSSSPSASGRLLYSYRFGSIPGIAGNPTTFGHDPYVAVRGDSGWQTQYVGLPADGMTDQTPYGSPLLGFDANLTNFAFGGKEICDPCFSDGSINIPLRRPDGTIEKGIPGGATADPGGGTVLKHFSDDGSHFIFATKDVVAAGGSALGSIYDRNLETNAVQLVSRLDSGTPMAGGQAAALDVSSDGSRILVALPTGTDSHGNPYWHPYMHVGTSNNTVDLAPGASDGVLYAGMSANGSRVFYATHDKLLPADTDESADIYEAAVSGSGPAALSLVSVDGTTPVNDSGCTTPDEWNAVGDEANCSALPFAGGAGVSDNGTIYFLSPDELDGGTSGEEADQPNVYRRGPGGQPEYVATPDTSVGKPPPPPPNRPIENAVFISGLNAPEAMTVDPANGNLYLLETGAGSLSRFNSAGAPVEFSATGNNKVTGLALASNSVRGVAVDDSASPFDGSIYVNDGLKVSVFSQTGAKLGEITGSTGPLGVFKAPCGVAVDPSGVVYVADKDGTNGMIYRYVPTGAAPITDADYGTPSVAVIAGESPCSLAADSLGNVFYAQTGGQVKKVTSGQFGTPSAAATPTTVGPAGTALSIDRSNDQLFVNEGTQFSVYTPGGTALIDDYGLGSLSNSRGMAVDPATHKNYTPNGSNVIKWNYQPPSTTQILDPAIVHALTQSEVHSYGDFQTSTDGRYAAFSSARPLTGYPTNGFTQLYRFDSQDGELDCASCPVSEINNTVDTTLPPYGQGLDDKGRLFFTTAEQLVLRDTNNVRDAYEWKENTAETARQQQLISTGSSPVDSSLLGVSQDGVDVFFFTAEVLTEEDENGGAIKVYTARENGGFPFLPPPVPCQAADECRGAVTPQPPAPNINTFTGGGPGRGNAGEGRKAKRCRKGFVKRKNRNGKTRCVKKKKRAAKKNQGTRNG